MLSTISITFGQLILGSSILTLSLGILQWLIANWLKTRLEQSIRHEYDKRLEDYKFLQLQRQKADEIATCFAKWIKYRGKEEDILNKNELIDYYEELNKMSLELSLWIKSPKLLNKIQDRFQMKPEAKDIRSITAEVRKYILNLKSDSFDPKRITLWPGPEDAIKLFKL